MKQRVTYFGLAALGMIVIWYFAALLPTSAKSKACHESIAEIEARLEDYNRTCLELPEFLEANENLEALRTELNSSLFAKGDILQLFHQIAQDARDHDLELVEISPPVSELLELNRRAIMENEPQFLNVRLDLRGQYIAFGKFVAHLESRPYFRQINSCQVRGTLESKPTIDMSVAFRALLGSVEDRS